MITLKQLLNETPADFDKDSFAAQFSTNPKHLDMLSDIHRSSDILSSIVNNHATHPDTLHKIALKKLHPAEQSYVHNGIAHNRNARHETLDHIAKNGSTSAVNEVASNPSTHPDTLQYIHTRWGNQFDHEVVKNPSTCATTLHSIAEYNIHNNYFDNVKGVIEHPNTSKRTLNHIANHRHVNQAEKDMAKKRLDSSK